MGSLLDQGSASADEPALTPNLSDLVDLPATPLIHPLIDPTGLEAFSHEMQASNTGVPAVHFLPNEASGSLVEDNWPPVLVSAFSSDPLLAFAITDPPAKSPSTRSQPLNIEIFEDQPFSVLLDGLVDPSNPLESISLVGGPDWLTAGVVEADASVGERLVVQTTLFTTGQERLLSSDLADLRAGSEIAIVIDVSDTRFDGQGLIGLQGSLHWNPETATVLAVDLADTLPLFRRSGDASEWADGETQLIAASLPKAGAGEPLGDTPQERFAEISLRLNNPSLPLGFLFTPDLYPAVAGRILSYDQLLNIGIDPQALPLLQGQVSQDFNGSIELQLQIRLQNGESWLQPLNLHVVPSNDAPQTRQAVVELPAIEEDSDDPSGTSVEDLFTSVFRDVDTTDQLGGVAITHIPDTRGQGYWQFAFEDQPWQTLDAALAVNEASALVLLPSDRLRFLPDPDWSSADVVAALQLRLIDSSVSFESGQRIDGGHSGSESALSSATVELFTRVHPVNDPPEAGSAAPPLFRGRQEEWFSTSLPADLFTDRDFATDPEEKLTYSLAPAAGAGALPDWLVIDRVSGRLSGIPLEVTPEPIAALVVVTDRSGATTARMITLAIKPVDPNNTRPSTQPFQRIELFDAEERRLDLNSIFVDPDVGDRLDFLAEIPAAYAHWIALDAEAGELLLHPGLADVTPSEFDVQVLLTATDRDGAQATQQLSLAVLNTNQAPVAVESAQPRLLHLNQGGTLELDLRGWFSDPDLPFGDSLSFSLEMSSGNPVGAGSLAWMAWLPDGSSVAGRPGNQDVGTLDLVAKVTDRAGLSAHQTLRLLIDNVNDAPQLTGLAQSLVSIDENTPLALDLSGWFEDPDALHGESFSLDLSARAGLRMPAWLAWDPETAVLTGTPTAADLGVLQLRLQASDGLAITSHAFKIEVNNVNDAPVVHHSLEPLTLFQDASASLNLSGAIADLDPGDVLRYSIRITDAAGQEFELDQQPWLHLKTSADSSISGDNRLLIQPVLRSVPDGRLLSPEDVSRLPAGSQIDVEIQVEDNRLGVAQAGLLGADLTLSWNPAVLAPMTADSSTLKRSISSSFPLFTAVDTAALEQGRLGLSAASAPAFGVGAVIGDQPAERFATVRMQLLDFGLPVVLSLSVNSEEQGGLGLGWQEESDAEARLELGSFSSSNRLDLEITPGNAEVGRYSIALSGTDLLGLCATTTFDLNVINVNDAPSVLLPLPTELLERKAYRFRLADFFSDPDLIHGDRLQFQHTGGALPGWVSISSDQQWLQIDAPAWNKQSSLEFAIAAIDSFGVGAQQTVTLSLRRKLLLGLDNQERQWITGLEDDTPQGRQESIHALWERLKAPDLQSRRFLPLQKLLEDSLGQPDSGDSHLASVEVILAADWLEAQGEFVTQLDFRVDSYVLSDERNVLDLVRAPSVPKVLLQDPSTALSYQALLEPIEFSADTQNGFRVVTIALPPDQPINSLVKTVFIDGQWLVAPFAVRALDLPSIRADALQAGFSAAAYRNLLDEQVNLFRLYRYPTGELLNEVRITPETDLRDLAETLPREQLDGSALLIDIDSDGVHDIARLLLLDNGFFDNDKVTTGLIDDPLFLARASLIDGGVIAGLGGGSGVSSSGYPARGLPVNAPPLGPSAPDPLFQEPQQLDLTPVQPSRHSRLSITRSGFFSAARGGNSQTPVDLSSSSSQASGDLNLPPPGPSSNDIQPRIRHGALAPLLQRLQRGFDALAEMELVDLLVLAAVVLPLTAQAGLQGWKQLKPFSLRLKNGDPSGAVIPPLACLVIGESLLDPLLEVWIENSQGRIRILSSLHTSEQSICTPQLYRPSQLWLWQRVRQTSRPGELVRACRHALQILEREGLQGSGLDCEAWLARTLVQHQERQRPHPKFVSNLDFIAQLLGCLANLGHTYQSFTL